MTRKKLSMINPKDYEHPFDIETREMLENTAGLDMLIRQVNKIGIERILKIQYTGSNLRVNKTNFPTLYNALEEACEILNIQKLPSFYIDWSYGINAFTAGIENPILVINSGCVDLLTEDELLFIIGHELGHIKSNHVLYYQMASFMPIITRILGDMTLGFGGTISLGVELALFNWQRMAELTADRAALLTCQDIKTATTALIKMAGLPIKYFNSELIDDFIEQAKEFQDYDYDALDLVAKVVSTMRNSHPWTVMRGAELLKWYDSGNYQNILDNSNSDWRKKNLPWQKQHPWKPPELLNF